MASSDRFPFHPTVIFDQPYWVFDFSRPQPNGWDAPYTFTVGRYDEHRPAMYTTELFDGVRDHHVGLDLGAPVGTPIHAFGAGTVYAVALNDEDGSYGPTLITQHHLALPDRVGGPLSETPVTFWVLYGHLSMATLERWKVGDRFEQGEVLAWMGDESENGGWPPHVHVQLAWKPPENGDLPGVVAGEHRSAALEAYPDPRLICGPLY
ncbi:MAG: peptidoglycan DD-metalloendopeptidase family protein [Poseidonia sp.]